MSDPTVLVLKMPLDLIFRLKVVFNHGAQQTQEVVPLEVHKKKQLLRRKLPQIILYTARLFVLSLQIFMYVRIFAHEEQS